MQEAELEVDEVGEEPETTRFYVAGKTLKSGEVSEIMVTRGKGDDEVHGGTGDDETTVEPGDDVVTGGE